MSIGQELLPEFDEEMKSTRRVLERIPDNKADWKPHPKSFTLAHLALLIAGMPGWITNQLQQTSLDLAKGEGYSNKSTSDLLKIFDKNVKEARAAIAASKDSDYDVPWSLMHLDTELFTAPRKVVIRQTISHLSHHRGQMTVYLRLLDIPVPSIYGPTADEKWNV